MVSIRRFMTAQSYDTCDLGDTRLRKIVAVCVLRTLTCGLRRGRATCHLIMNHTTTDPALPKSAPCGDIRLRIAGAGIRMENLFSLSCVGVLLLMPIMFALAHIAADGAVWNFATGEKFDPFFKNVFWQELHLT